jgi:hypothetical protein
MTATSLMDSTLATPKVLVSQQLTTSETTQYTTVAANWVKIGSARLSNTSGAAVTVSISLVKTGGTAGSANRVLAAYSLAAGDGIALTELTDAFLGPGDFISAIASAATSVAFVMSGVVFS